MNFVLTRGRHEHHSTRGSAQTACRHLLSSHNPRLLTYQTAGQALGRDPVNNSRMVAQVCDLLDAVAALAGVPLLALVMVREV
jgi:hypothetical protein